MRVVVTGGAGFIGTNLVLRLAANDGVDDVVVFDDFSTGVRREEHDAAQVVEGDLRDISAVTKALEGADRVVHLGALGSVPRSIKDPQTTNAVNINGTLNVLEAARLTGVEHLISASSSSVYGANPQIPKIETMATMPVSPYAVSKLATEAYTTAYARSFGLSTLAFRFFNVFGPYQRSDHAYAAVIPRFLEAIKNGVPLPVHGDGTQSRDFTSVHSVTDALSQAVLAKTSSPTPVNLAFGRRFTLNQLIEVLAEIHGAPLERVTEPSRAGDVPHSQASPDRLNELLPAVEAPAFEDAVAETYRWYFGLPR